MPPRALNQTPFLWTKVRGRNGYDHPASLPADMAVEATNVTFGANQLCRRANGTSAITATYNVAPYKIGPYVTDGVIIAPAGTPYLFWTADPGTGPVPYRATTLTTTTPVLFSLIDAHTGTGGQASWAQLGGKMYLAYPSAVNRLHVWDGTTGGPTNFRRVGLKVPAAPTAADTGSGSYAATLRYYRVAWRSDGGSPTSYLNSQSLLGASVSFTPSGSGTAARITQPTVAGEGETHWLIFGSIDNAVYYEVAKVAIGTTTYDDSAAPSSLWTGILAPLEGAYTPWPSVKYLLSDGTRLFGFGVYGTSAGDALPPIRGRVYFSPVQGTTTPTSYPVDDAERVSNTTSSATITGIQGWIDVGVGIIGTDTGIAGPVNGQVLVFQTNGVYALNKTGDPTQPFSRTVISTAIGAFESSMRVGEDEMGQPCVYWADPVRGPYRYGVNGLQWLGYDVQDLWKANTTFLFTGYHAGDRSVWYFVSDGVTTKALRFDTKIATPTAAGIVRYGWSLQTGVGVNCRDAVSSFFANISTQGCFIGAKVDVNKLANLDDSAQVCATASQIVSPAFTGGDFALNKLTGKGYVQAPVAAATTLTQTLTRDYGLATRSTTASIAAAASETRVVRRFEGLELTQFGAAQVTLGDATGVSGPTNWQIDQYLLTWEPQEER